MANLFQPKRVVVPGLLSDEGLAAQVKELTSAQKATADAAPPNTSAVEFADQVSTMEQGKLGKIVDSTSKAAEGARLAAQDAASTKIGTDIAGAVSAVPGVKELSQIGVLSEERALEEQQARAKAAQEEVDYLRDLNKAIESGQVPVSTIPGTSQEKLQFAVDQLAGRRRELIEAEDRLAREKSQVPKYEWWRNAAEVAARSAAMVGVDTLKYPVSVWDLSAEMITGEKNRSDVGIWLDGVDKALNKMLPGDPAQSKDFLTDVASGAGSMTGFLIGGFAARAVGLPAAVGSGVLGAAVTGNQQYEDAQNFDATVAEKWIALIIGSGLGATEAIPIDRAFFRADQATGGFVRQLLANTTATSLEEFTQELSQAVGQDLIAKFTYDEDRDLNAASWLRQATVGAIVGGGSGALITVIEQGGQRREVDVADTDDTKLTAAAEEAINAAQQDFDTALGDEAADLPGLGGAVDGVPADEGAQAAAGDGAVAGATVAGAQAEAARPVVAADPVRQIVEKAKPVKVEAPAGGETAQLDGVITYKDGGTAGISLRAVKRADGSFASERTITDDDGTVTVEHLADGFQWRKGPAPVTVVTGFTSQTADAFSDAAAAVAMARDMSPGSIAWAADGTQTGSVEQVQGQPAKPLSAKAQALDVTVTRAPSKIGKGYGDYVTYTEPSGGVVRVVERENAARAASVVDFVVPEALRGQGIGRALMERVLADNPSLMGQVSSRAAAKLAYDMGRRPFNQPDATLEDIYRIIESDSSVNLLTPELAAVAAEAGANPVSAETEAQVGRPADPDIVAQVDAVQLEPHQVSPLPDIEKGLTGPIPRVVQAAKAYAAAIGLPHRRARSYVKVDTARAARIADAYAKMKHEPNDPVVQAAYRALAEETQAQYQYVKATGLKIEAILPGQPDPYPNGPRDVLKDINAGHIWYFPTDQGFGSSEFDPAGNPLLEATDEVSDNGQPMVVNDLFRVVHDFFGHGLEGTGFGPRGEENAWQSHMRLFTTSAVPAMTSETRGQNSWVNYGPFGAQNRANPRETIYADQKTGIMPEWTWTEGVVDSTAEDVDAPVEIESMVGAPLIGAPLAVQSKPKVSDVARAFDDAHQAAYGRKLFPELSEEDYALTVAQAVEDFASHVVRPGSGIGWYSADVATAIELTALAYPTLATEPAHRDLYLTFAGIFSNGATPEQAWGMSAEAFDMFLASGAIQSKRGGGKKWGVRDAANVQQIELVKYLVEREGSLEAAMAWLKGIQKRTDINAAMTESGLYKAGRFTTKAEQQGETFGFLAFGGKLGRYTLGLHGVELEADNTTVDLWYTRTFRRWTGRLFDAPISAEGIAGGVANERERDVIFRLTADIQAQYPQLTAGDVQAVLWFFEKRLYAEHGVRTSEGTNSSGARKLLAARGIEGGAQRDEGGATGAEPAATTAVGRFHAAFLEAKIASPFGAAVHAYSPAELAKMRLFLAPDGLSGFALKGEDIVSVFTHPRAGGQNRSRKSIDTAIANGGKTLDCFDGKLVQIYSALGFREVRRESWNDEYRPDGWKDEWGKPDVVYMEYGQDVERMEAREDARAKWHEGSHEYFKNDDGTPKVFYHGTVKGGFRVFDTRPDNAKTEGTGAWFTPSRSQAASYGSREDIELVDYDVLAEAILTGTPTDVGSGTYTLTREDDGIYIEQSYKRGKGESPIVYHDGPFESDTEVREFLSDQFEDDSRQEGVYSVYLRAKNPIIIDWGGASWMEGPMERVWNIYDPRDGDPYAAPVDRAYDEEEARAMAQSLLDDFDAEDAETYEIDDFIKEEDAPGYQSTDAYVRELKENMAGEDFDAIVLQNVDGVGPNGYGDGVADEIVIWDETSIKSTANIGTYNPTDPDILRMTGTATQRLPYALEPTRPTRGIAARPGEAPNDVRLTKIADNLVKALNLTVRHGRLVGANSDVMGQFNRRTGVIRLRTWTDLSTLAHEAGHAINDQMAAPLDAFVNANLAEFNKIAKIYQGDLSQATGTTVRREGFAEFFRVYTMTPDYARNTWTQLTTDFEALLDREDPQIKTSLNAIAAQVRAWQQLPSGRLIENTVIDGRREQGIGPALKELRELGFKSWMQEFTRRNIQWSTNRYAALNRLVTDLLNEGEQNRGGAIDLERADDPRVLARLARNSGSRGMIEVTDGVMGYRSTQPMSKGLREAIMVSQGVDPNSTPGSFDEERLHTFSAYLVARRALEEFRRYDAGEIDRQPVAFSKGDAARAVKEWESQYPDFVKAAQIVHEYGMALWQKSYDAGLISKETYEENLTRQFYAPLQRDMSDKREALGDSALTTRGSGPLRSIVRRFRGSDRDIIDPLAILMQKTFALEALISENDAKKALAVLSDRVGQAGALVERIPASQLMGQEFGVREVARQLTGLEDMADTDAADLMTILGASIKNGDTISLFRSQQASAKGEPVLFFWENGKVAAIQVKDGDIGMDVVNTLNGVGRENMDKLLEGVAATSTVFRTAITSWPDFLLVNFIRDQMSAWILNDVGFVPFVSGIRGVADEVRQKGWAKLYNYGQGIMGGMNVAAQHTAHVDRDIRALRSKGYIANVFGDVRSGWDFPNAIKGLARISAVTETGTRLGLFRGAFNRAKREGLDDYQATVEASYTATDYIDFGLNGSRMMTTRRLIPFFNAQIQGFYKMVRTLGGDEVAQRKGLAFALTAYFKNINNLPLSRVEKQQLRTGRKAWLKMLSLGLIGAALHYLFKDDEDYQEAGEYLRTTGWVIPTGDGKLFYIPKPFELAMVSNAVERGLEAASGDGAATGRFLRGVAFNLSPPTSPPLFTLGFEVPNNIDTFTGRPIVPDYMRSLPPELQYDNTTSSIAKWMGDTFDWSPMVIDHVLSGLGASAYRDIATMTNLADPTRPSLDAADAPILRRFVRDVRRGSVSAQDFWAQASSTNGKLAEAAAGYKYEKDAGNEPAANRRLAAMTADQRAFAVLMTDFKAEEKRLNPFYRATQITSLVSKMRRETSSALSLGDTTVKDSTDTIPLTSKKKREVDTILSEIARREVRNTLIATGQPGWIGKQILPVEPTIEMLLAVSPEVYDEFQRRWQKAKVYDAQTVYDYWPDVRDRLVQDGPDAILSDAVAVASAGL